MLTSWILYGDTQEPYHYSFNFGMQISLRKRLNTTKSSIRNHVVFLQKIRTC